MGVRWRNGSQLSQRNAYRTVGFLSDICETAILSFWVVKTHLAKRFAGAERALSYDSDVFTEYGYSCYEVHY